MRSVVLLSIIVSALFFSCSSEKETREADFTVPEEVEDLIVARITLKITNFENWLNVITDSDNLSTDGEIRTMGIFRDAAEENMVYVFLGSRDIEKLRDYINSEGFDNKFTIPSMGKPEVEYVDVIQLVDQEFEQSYRLLISHKIIDFLKWKPYFDNDLVTRSAHDLTTIGLGRSTDDPSMIHVLFAYNIDTLAEEYFADPTLKAKMEEAGVMGEIEMIRMQPLPDVEF